MQSQPDGPVFPSIPLLERPVQAFRKGHYSPMTPFLGFRTYVHLVYIYTLYIYICLLWYFVYLFIATHDTFVDFDGFLRTAFTTMRNWQREHLRRNREEMG